MSSTRYGFGKNWKRFLERLNDEKISLAKTSLQELTKIESFTGKTFLDIGSGSGLFSLAAIQLGAEHVHSFDYDQDSVDCALILRERYNISEDKWKIERGSILDTEYLESIPKTDVVYSWGVLHHTGEMWNACENASKQVVPSGTLTIALYNEQGPITKMWTIVKKLYNRGPHFQIPLIILFQLYFSLVGLIADLLIYRRSPHRRYTEYQETARGMSRYTDLLDWLGGYPFEVTKPDEVVEFFTRREFSLIKLRTVGGGHACNEFTFIYSGRK